MNNRSTDPRTTPEATNLTGHSWGESWVKFWPLALAAALIAISVAVRIAVRGVVTSDLDFHILPWYFKLQSRGVLTGIGQDFYNYTPPYLYLLALATLTSSLLSPVSAVKIISTAFDVYAAFMIFKIVRLHYPRGYLPVLAGALFFAAPTVVANTGVWGQADSTYAAFLLTCLYFLLVDRALLAVIFFAVALAFKPQAIFFIPLLLLMILKRKVPWYDYLVVPVVYALLMLPAVILGRTWSEVFTVYIGQAGSGKGLTHNAPTLYVFLPKSAFAWLLGAGIVLAVLALLSWVIFSWIKVRTISRPVLLLLALTSVTLTPFFLPNMHDRYFYLSDAISIALAFVTPGLWFMPILFQLSSGLAYSIYLLSASPDNLELAAALNTLAIVILLYKQVAIQQSPRAEPAPAIPRT